MNRSAMLSERAVDHVENRVENNEKNAIEIFPTTSRWTRWGYRQQNADLQR